MTMRMKVIPIFSHCMSVYQENAERIGWSKAEAIKASCLSRQQWSAMLTGKIGKPNVWTALGVAQGLGVRIDDLLLGDHVSQQFAMVKQEGRLAQRMRKRKGQKQ